MEFIHYPYVQATWEEPGEEEDISIVSVNKGGRDCFAEMSEEEFIAIAEKCWEHLIEMRGVAHG